KILCLVGLDIYACAPSILDDVLERDPIWDWDNHLVAVVHENLDGVEQGLLTTGRRDRLINRVVRTKVGRMALHDGFAQLRHASYGGVLREILLDSGDPGILDVLRRVEVRLAHAQVASVDSLREQLRGLCRHSNRG